MYESYWQLQAKPFEPGPDLQFYYPSEMQQSAALKLQYAIQNRRPGALLAGPAGVGKTMLVEWLAAKLPPTIKPRLHLFFPRMNSEQFVRWIASTWEPARESVHAGVDQCVQQLERSIAQNRESGNHAILVIDEAHVLDHDHFEVLRLLMNFCSGPDPAMTVVLVGQPALLPRVERFSTFEERLGVKCLLRPFSLEESMSYVSSRLRAAGCQRTIFDDDGLHALHELSGGVARRINRLADLALLVGYAEQADALHAGHIQSVSDELVAIRPE